MKLSIIVPIYNSERYLSRTLEALLNQNCGDFEVILIDDGSKDRSGDICKEFIKEHDHFSYCKTENNGVSSARNQGIQRAGGEWIAFCDADDLPNADMYKKLIEKAERCGAELCVCDFYSERDGKEMGFPWENELFSGQDILTVFMASMIGNRSDNETEVPFWGSVCRGVYRKEIIDKHRLVFPTDLKFAEDLVFSLNYAAHCKQVAVVRETLYRYTCNPVSAMNTFAGGYVEKMFESRKRLVQYIEDAVPQIKNDAFLQKRLKTTERCYYSECLGNAFIKTAARGSAQMIEEARIILNDERTKAAFKHYDAENPKKKLVYFGMKHKLVCIFFVYYRLRFLGKER